MSGHSKWATTKRQKSITDAKRANLFTKLGRNITLAAKNGANPDMNFKLRIAIDAARAANVPRDTIERAINKAKDSQAEGSLNEILYEGFGPFGILVLIEVLTDNKNRSLGEVRTIFSKYGGALGGQNSVAWNFNYVGIIKIKDKISPELESKIIEAGANDFKTFDDDDYVLVYTTPQDLQTVQNNLIKLKVSPEEAALEFIPKETIQFKNEEEEKTAYKFLDELDDLADVKQCYTNIN